MNILGNFIPLFIYQVIFCDIIRVLKLHIVLYLSSMELEKPMLLDFIKKWKREKKKQIKKHFSLIAYAKDSNAAEVCCTLIGYTMYNNSKNGEKGINETKTTDWA